MTQVQDDLYFGNGNAIGTLVTTANGNPTENQGVGPAGRVFPHNVVPLTKQANNIALSQHMTLSTALVLTAGTGVTSTTAPDGSGRTVLQLDTPRCVAIISTANLSGMTFTVSGFDQYGQPMTQTLTGPNNATVNTKKAFRQILSVTPSATDGANNVTVGTADIFGMNFVVLHNEYVASVKWGGALAQDGGVFTPADTTSPATASTGDIRGTYAPSSASDGAKRLTILYYMDGTQVGYNSTRALAVGVTQV